jgi:pyruvate/2-oxoglutarate dehydrogenase complex dihydrolipoamide acyltransferase (E2) component
VFLPDRNSVKLNSDFGFLKHLSRLTPLKQLPVPEVDSYGTFEDVPNNNMRKVIAKRLTESKRDVPTLLHIHGSRIG